MNLNNIRNLSYNVTGNWLISNKISVQSLVINCGNYNFNFMVNLKQNFCRVFDYKLFAEIITSFQVYATYPFTH